MVCDVQEEERTDAEDERHVCLQLRPEELASEADAAPTAVAHRHVHTDSDCACAPADKQLMEEQVGGGHRHNACHRRIYQYAG